jgi:hypothetical protein
MRSINQAACQQQGSQSGGNQVGSVDSRSYRSGPVRKMVGCWTLTAPIEPDRTEETGLPTDLFGLLPGFFGLANRTGSDLVNSTCQWQAHVLCPHFSITRKV